MRLVLKQNKQKELIEKEKQIFNLSFSKLARKLRIADGKLKAYYYDGILLPEKIFERFELKKEFEKYIIQKKSDTWGQSIGGKLSEGSSIKELLLPPESIELSEFYGIMLGDGNLTKIKKYKIRVYQIKIVGDSRHDKDYLVNFVKPLMENLFKIKVNLYKPKVANALYLSSTSKRLVEFLETKGFKPGNKITNKLGIPQWIKSNNNYLRACIRGLFDTDGCIYKLTNQNSYQICFTNYNPILLNDVRNSLIYLGIKPSKITKNRDIMITKRSELQRFLKEIRFSNFKHLNKAKLWNLAP